MRLEHKMQPLLPRRQFVHRLLRYGAYALLLIVVSMVIGTVGYHWLAALSWVDAYLNAAMILTGMGPVNPMETNAAKIFSGLYALYSGIVFLTVAAMMFTPLAHRLLHIFHLEKK
ncbi:hypothetical protein KTO58_01900 [Chitinophaga pendula]|uniref:hypothetical protein n=1 Tax=Chitinophaga TaxID=79328 RepID=UPI000BAF7ADF|nr:MULTISPECIES: hypothetical protein [Chitinophaga]ASZ14391.1 hypothetical protein CK934_27325 [Chitinophaga sp. MD30]UCJ07957.1 hypothetical protein KTO58_01900 [Chitinophaga pendula]